MITDDPGTPGNGHWENNLAIAFEHRPNEWSIDAPGIDLNYGLGDHIQLTLQTSLAILKRSDHGAVAGMGGTEAAVKWRFLDEEKSGARCLDVSAHHFQCCAVFGSARTFRSRHAFPNSVSAREKIRADRSRFRIWSARQHGRSE